MLSQGVWSLYIRHLPCLTSDLTGVQAVSLQTLMENYQWEFQGNWDSQTLLREWTPSWRRDAHSDGQDDESDEE